MKNSRVLFCLILAAFTHGCVFGQASTYPWKVVVNVDSENGEPILDADVVVSYTLPPSPGRNPEEGGNSGEIKGSTDKSGRFSASHTDGSWGLAINVEKPGYYTTHIGHDLYVPGQFDEKTVATSRNSNLTIVLKKIGKTIPMYAKRLHQPVPTFDKPLGFDLMTGDWVSPNGKGTKSDLVFTAHEEKRSEFDWDYKLVVSFPNAGDGIQEFKVTDLEKGSALRSAHDAPSEGYLAQWVQTTSARPHQGGYSGNRDDNRNYYFRVRTVLDEHGNVKSALYGKIYGDFMQFTYYLNPTANDRNIEFDPKQNLIQGLKSFEQVSVP